MAWQAVLGIRYNVPKSYLTAPPVHDRHASDYTGSLSGATTEETVSAALQPRGADSATAPASERLLRIYGPLGVGAFVWEACRFSRPRTIAGVEFHEFVPAGTPLSALPPSALYNNNLPPSQCPPMPLRSNPLYHACQTHYSIRYYFADETTDLSQCVVEASVNGPRVVVPGTSESRVLSLCYNAAA